MAMAVIVDNVATIRISRAFMDWILSGLYQPLTLDSGVTLDPPLRPSCHKDTKTDLTLGRSVALLAQPHPKCPFQVRLRRVRAY